jgi:hypothetical protein
MRHVGALCACVLALALIAGCSQQDNSLHMMDSMSTVGVGSVNGTPGQYCTDLFAGQDIPAGDVCVEVKDYGDTEELCVTFTTTDGWVLIETHTWVGEDLADMPQTRKGNPQVGLFPYHSGDITGQTTYTVCIDLNQFGTEGGAIDLCDAMLYVAAHAVVAKDTDGDGSYDQTETAWGDGQRIVNRGNWATYFTVILSCETGGGGGTETGETAFAYSCDAATCFLDIVDEDGTGFNRWGWSNGPFGSGTYYFDIYAGAGQCDLSKGTLVGLLTLDYDGATATVTYNTCGTYTMDEAHVYVGNEILARDVNGDYTVAPGQYPVVADDLDGATTYSTSFSVTGDIYIVAHAVVVGDYSQGSCGEPGCLPPGPPCDPTAGIVYGMAVTDAGQPTGKIYKVNPADGTADSVFTSVLAMLNNNSTPNGLAYDGVNKRLYYANYKTGSTARDLFFWEEGIGEFNAGTLALDNSTAPAENAAADFYAGKYYYILSLPASDDLYEVTFDADGYIASQSKIADISGNAHSWEFYGDIAIKDGILYGWGLCKVHNRYEFFTYDLDSGDFSFVVTAYTNSLQLAFGSNGTILYGHDYYSGAFRTIDIVTGAVSDVIPITPSVRYTDCASGQQCQ